MIYHVAVKEWAVLMELLEDAVRAGRLSVEQRASFNDDPMEMVNDFRRLETQSVTIKCEPVLKRGR